MPYQGVFAVAPGHEAIVITASLGGYRPSGTAENVELVAREGQVATGQAALDLLTKIVPEERR